ncbi:MAG: DNA-processing protein DprA [Bacteroidota bacterium]
MSLQSESLYPIALSRVPQVGPLLGRHLIAHCGTAEEVFHTPARQLRKIPGIADRTIEYLQAPQPLLEAEAILEYAQRKGIQIYYFADSSYPRNLQVYQQAPLILYAQGEVNLSPDRSLAVVGTRKVSREGIRQTERLLEPMVDFQPLIISGLAYGVDIQAHRSAIKLGLPTVAVLGSGHAKIYPSEHQRTAEQMLENGGVLSTYPYWQKPEREHFPARNRVVAMLTDCTVVVESGTKGGSVITARMTAELNKPVGACPGRGGHPHTAGCNQLIKSGLASMICSGEDVAELLNWRPQTQLAKQAQLFAELSPDESQIVAQFKERAELAVDELKRELDFSPAQLAGKLLAMECKGLLDVLPGQRYRLTGVIAG